MKKLFVSDVDNTLVSEKKPDFTERFKEVLKKIENSDHEFILCSGRPTVNLVDLALDLKKDNINLKYVSGFNGVQVYDLEKSKLIINNSLTYSEVDHICEVLNQKDLNYMIFDQKCLRTNIPDNYWVIRESKLLKQYIEPISEYCSSPKVLLVVEAHENIKIINELKNSLPEYNIFDSAPHFIEIVKKGVNKATPLKEIAKYENFNIKNTYGFGDSGNDIELIKEAGVGVAVENARDEIKDIADVVVGHVDDDSVAIFIEKIL